MRYGLGKVINNKNLTKFECVHEDSKAFKAILLQKREARKFPPTLDLPKKDASSVPIIDAVNSMVSNHEMATKSLKTFMMQKNYSPEKLLSVHFKSNIFFLREQMFTKTAELSANTVKNFTANTN